MRYRKYYVEAITLTDLECGRRYILWYRLGGLKRGELRFEIRKTREELVQFANNYNMIDAEKLQQGI